MLNMKSSRAGFPALISLLAVCACGPAVSSTPLPTGAPPILPTAMPTQTEAAAMTPAPQPSLAALTGQVSPDRLIGDVKALSAIPSRHINNPGITKAADYIEGQMKAAGGSLQVAYQGFPLTVNGQATNQRNVIATLPGSDPSAGVIVIGAHYDSRTRDLGDSVSLAPGANDNATGSAIVVELARIFAATSPRATLDFVTFAGEEEGRLGSQYFMAAFNSHPDIRAMIALDIMGMDPGGTHSARLYSPGPADSPSRRLAVFMAQHAAEGSPGFTVTVEDASDRPGRYSDHLSFSDAGYPAARFIQPQEDPANHSPDDTADRLDPDYMARVTRAVLAGIYDLAWGDTRFTP